MSESHAGPELTVIVPFHNEEELAPEVVTEWSELLSSLGISYELRLYDDGSTDSTAEILSRLAARDPQIVVVRHENRGHGPTVLRGYREARGEWIFQADGDGEIDVGGFEPIWRGRHYSDLTLGFRTHRPATLERSAVTVLARTAVRLLFGVKVRDSNTPFRLMRKEALSPLLPSLPESCFAPNVLICGLAGRAGWRIDEQPVEVRPRRSESSPLRRGRLWRSAASAGRETLLVAWRSRRVARGIRT